MKNIKKHFLILIILFGLILVWGILFKMNRLHTIEHNFNIMIKKDYYERLTWSLNPFVLKATTKKENILNFISFIPFGFLAALLVDKLKLVKVLSISFALSLLFEVTQVFTAIGGFATIDLIANALGGVAGGGIAILLEMLFRKISSQSTKSKVIKTFIIICYIIFIPIVIYGSVNTIINIDFYISLYK